MMPRIATPVDTVSAERGVLAAVKNEESALGAIARRVAGGDESALQALYDRTVGRCYAVAIAMLGEGGAAEDAIERAYVAYWSARAQAEAIRAPLDALLANTRRAALALAGADAEPPDLLARLDPGTSIYRVVAALAPEERRILARSFLQGLDAAAIAQAERLSLAAVRATLRELTTLVRAARQ